MMINSTEWAYLPLSEERVVAQQIKNRSKQDAAYTAFRNATCIQASEGGFGINEAVLCTYIDLDRQIEESGLPAQQGEFVNLLMDGYSIADIAQLHGHEYGYVERQFRNAVNRIVRENQRQWEAVYARKSDRARK